MLDGDAVRRTLGFSKADRDTHVRRLGFAALLLARCGTVSLVAAIAPLPRRAVRATIAADGFEVYVRCPLDVLVERDPKGL